MCVEVFYILTIHNKFLMVNIYHSFPFFLSVYCSYTLKDSNINDANFEKLNGNMIPDIILVKKFYGYDKAARRRARVWKLKHINDEVISMSTDNK